MGRVERFREIRRIKRRMAMSLCTFVLLVTIGLCVSDYYVNSLLLDEKKVEIVSIKSDKGGSYIEMCLMNQKFYINIVYIYRDLQRLKGAIANIDMIMVLT